MNSTSIEKRVLYIMVNQFGDVKTFSCPCHQDASDAANLYLWRPDSLRGNMQTRFQSLTEKGYSLSNWHVILKGKA